MTFCAWLATQAHRNDLVGEIAQQATRCKDWPKTGGLVCFRVYLARDAATPLAIRAVEIAFEEWDCSKHLPPVNCVESRSRQAN